MYIFFVCMCCQLLFSPQANTSVGPVDGLLSISTGIHCFLSGVERGEIQSSPGTIVLILCTAPSRFVG